MFAGSLGQGWVCWGLGGLSRMGAMWTSLTAWCAASGTDGHVVERMVLHGPL